MNNCKIHRIALINGYCIHCVRNQLNVLESKIRQGIEFKHDLMEENEDDPQIDTIQKRINTLRDEQYKLETESGISTH